MNPFLIVVILGIVEGMTEFLPVSSTGHMILVEKFIGNGNLSKNFMESFLIIVQLGAILAVVIYFWKDLTPFVKEKNQFISRIRLWTKVIIGVLPAAIIGLLLDDYISAYFMDNVFVVATTLIFYGIILILIEKYYKTAGKIDTLGKLSYKLAFIIGFFQCLAMIPGTSRSGSTIIGSLLLGLSRGVATEFSFFLGYTYNVWSYTFKTYKKWYELFNTGMATYRSRNNSFFFSSILSYKMVYELYKEKRFCIFWSI